MIGAKYVLDDEDDDAPSYVYLSIGEWVRPFDGPSVPFSEQPGPPCSIRLYTHEPNFYSYLYSNC